MIPPGREAAFFSLYEVTNSGTSWIGPFLFAAVVGATNSYREALLSLIVLFVGEGWPSSSSPTRGVPSTTRASSTGRRGRSGRR
jgi:Vacuole effluxer Atg22 like